MRNHLIVTVLSAATASALVLVLGAAGPLSRPDVAAAATRASADGRAAAPGGTWGKAEEVPGSAALNTAGVAEVRSLSCGSVGNCSAGGNIQNSAGDQAWVASEVHGTWGRAEEVPGTSALNAGGSAAINSVSCPSASNCAAAGQYRDRSRHTQAFVINESSGTWGMPAKVAAPTTNGSASIDTVSCPVPGSCSAGGSYSRIGTAGMQAFIVNEVHGSWGRAQEVPGIAALDAGGNAGTGSVSCASAGNCSAGGSYRHGMTGVQVFVVNEVHGSWGRAEEVPGSAALNRGGNAIVASLSCASASHCSAGGYYRQTNSIQQVFVVNKS